MSPSEKRSNFISEDKVAQEANYWGIFVRLWPYVRRQMGVFTLAVASVVVLALVGRVIPNLFGYAIDDGILKKDLSLLTKIAMGYLVAEICRSLLLFSHRYLFNRLGNRVLYELRSDLMNHIQSLPMTYFDRNPVGRVVTRATNDIIALGELFSKGLVTVLSDSISLLAILGAMLLISVKLTLWTLAIAPPLFFVVIHLSRKVKETLRIAKKQLAEINSFVSENISGMRILQLYNRVAKNLRKFYALSSGYTKTQLRSVRYFALLWPTLSLFNAVTIAMALFWGGYLKAEDAIGIGALIAFFMHLQDFQQPLQHILDVYNQLQNTLTSAERIFDLLDEPAESLEGEVCRTKLSGQITFKGVFFRYSKHLPWALKDVDLDIRPGESVALVGRTGSGKSTMISLLQRFYQLERGVIYFDGQDHSMLAVRSLRRRMGVVQQDNFIFRGTIGDNVSLNHPEISREQVERAVERAQCSDLIYRHKSGLDRLVEERGANLSAGERQLISFARIFAFDPDILILDEATANIDSHSESRIQRATNEIIRNRTSVIIAHRLSTILNCDRIIVLSHGNIVEQGSHRELLSQKGAYYDLYTSQNTEFVSH